MEKTKQLVSMIVGVIVVILIVVALAWLSSSTNRDRLKAGVSKTVGTSGNNLTPQETAQILEQLNKPVIGADGKVVPPPKPAEASKILEELNKPPKGTSATAKQPSPEESARILEELNKPVK